MPRKARDYYIADFYHIMIQGDEKKFIFQKNYQKDRYIYLLKRNAFRNDIKLIAYCVMDNHVHVLVHCKEIDRLSKMMLQCNTSYGLYFSKQRKIVGHVFRERYKSQPIFSKLYLLNCVKYIHENPVKANIESKCENYQYSSYMEYLNKINPLYNEAIDICDFSNEEIEDIVKNSHTEIQYIDEEESGKFKKIFNKIKKDYDMKNLTDTEITQIYKRISKQSKINKAELARLLNIKRTTLLNKLNKD